jgi:hypothetical protein
MGENLDLPEPTTLEKLTCNFEFSGGVWTLIKIDMTKLDTRANQRPVHLKVSILTGLRHEIDTAARAQRATGSGFLGKAARSATLA